MGEVLQEKERLREKNKRERGRERENIYLLFLIDFLFFSFDKKYLNNYNC